MTGFALAREIFLDTARSNRGCKFSSVSRTLRSQAETLQQHVAASGQNDVADELVGFTDDTRKKVDCVFAHQRKGGTAALQESAKNLQKTATNLCAAAVGTDMKNTRHDGQTLAQAQLGRPGSETADLEKMMGENAILDTAVVVGAGAHEKAHTRQKAQSVSRVFENGLTDNAPVSNTLDDIPKSGEVTSAQLEEAGAIVAQKKAAPESFKILTRLYKDAYAHVLSYVPDENRIVELAQRSDGLVQLQHEAMRAR